MSVQKWPWRLKKGLMALPVSFLLPGCRAVEEADVFQVPPPSGGGGGLGVRVGLLALAPVEDEAGAALARPPQKADAPPELRRPPLPSAPVEEGRKSRPFFRAKIWIKGGFCAIMGAFHDVHTKVPYQEIPLA